MVRAAATAAGEYIITEDEKTQPVKIIAVKISR